MLCDIWSRSGIRLSKRGYTLHPAIALMKLALGRVKPMRMEMTQETITDSLSTGANLMKANNMEMTTTKIELLEMWDMVANIVFDQEGWDSDTDWGEHTYIHIEPVCYGNYTIDSIMVFADGTIEFREIGVDDAFNWSEYSHDVNTQVFKNVIDVISNK